MGVSHKGGKEGHNLANDSGPQFSFTQSGYYFTKTAQRCTTHVGNHGYGRRCSDNNYAARSGGLALCQPGYPDIAEFV